MDYQFAGSGFAGITMSSIALNNGSPYRTYWFDGTPYTNTLHSWVEWCDLSTTSCTVSTTYACSGNGYGLQVTPQGHMAMACNNAGNTRVIYADTGLTTATREVLVSSANNLPYGAYQTKYNNNNILANYEIYFGSSYVFRTICGSSSSNCTGSATNYMLTAAPISGVTWYRGLQVY